MFKLVLARLGERQNAFFSACNPAPGGAGGTRISSQEKTLVRALAAVCVLILLYCLVGAVNARATYDPESGMLEYHACVSWLPSSLDSAATWYCFWRLLALICWFWSVRHYLTGTPGPFQADRLAGDPASETAPTRLVRLLWVLMISGTALSLVGIVQRLLHSPRLLFLRAPELSQDPFTQFAAFAYRGNAAQYFNLVWPVCLGFVWSSLPPARRTGRWLAALVCVAVMSLVPIISAARAATLAALAMFMTLVPALLVWSSRHAHQSAKTRANHASLPLIASLLAIGAVWGCKQLWPRWQHWRSDLAAREQLYAPARLMARDFPVFGTGPGAFEHVYGLYRPGPRSEWPAQLHNDWLETRITFGFAGIGLFLLALVCIFQRWIRSGPCSRQPVVVGLWCSVAGCLVQARWDFPLQIYSIASLLVFWLAVLFSLPVKTREGAARA